MPAKLVITPKGLQELREGNACPNKAGLKVVAHFISYLFHPVFVPIYVLALLLFVEPFLFVGVSIPEKVLTLGRAFVNYTFFPLISIFLLKALNFIQSIKLKEQKDRIIPFIICNIWYFWIWYVWRNQPEVPRPIVVFAMGIFLASSIGLLANIYIKISMHGIAMGTAVAFLAMLTIMPESANMSLYFAISLLISGLVGSSRLLLGEHTPKEYYYGLLAGIISIIIASLFM